MVCVFKHISLAHKESTLLVFETKVNEESAMVLYNPETDLVDLITTKEDSEDDDDLDKQTLSKRFKIMHPIPSKPQPSEKKSEEDLKKLLNPTTFKAQALKWEEHEEKKAKMLKEFNKCISERTSPLPITKISYVVNSSKTETMRITRDKDPLNLKVYPDFRLRMLGFSKWLEVHALASKKLRKSYDVLLQSLTTKFQWVLNQAKTLGLPPPPELATFGLTAEEKC
ncbi:hypothetical protein Tco_1535337 [Tanacetum coccineum]